MLAQTLLTLASPLANDEAGFLVWLACVSLALGIGVPVMFSMTVDLVPVRLRGGAAAWVTALAYFAANAFSHQWAFEVFRQQSLILLIPGTLGMGLMAFIRHPWLDRLSCQHELPAFAQGRFARQEPTRRLLGLIVIMFTIYFVDSLGFIRLHKTPLYMISA